MSMIKLISNCYCV